MKEFKDHIKFYKSYWHQHFSKIIPENKWGNEKLAEEYLQKYWLAEEEYLRMWKPIQDKIFIEDKGLPNLIYHSEYEIIVVNGGCLFIEDDFLQLQKAMQEVEEKYFVVIQNIQEYTKGEPVFRMKFPVDITWKELTNGNYISAVLLEMSLNEYYVFGANGRWGKYSANDYKHPLDIIGFKQEVAFVFHENFKQLKEDKEEIQKYLPHEYIKLT